MRVLVSLILLLIGVAKADDSNYESARTAMVNEVQQFARFTNDIYDANFSEPVLAAMNKVERHKLVPPSERRFAYENRPLPIGHGQTISQPYIVALMTELVAPDADDVILEVGTGSGYQAAILAELAEHVYSIEIIEALATRARRDLRDLGYEGVESVRVDKTITLEVAGDDATAVEAEVKTMCERLLANPVMEDFEIQVHP